MRILLLRFLRRSTIAYFLFVALLLINVSCEQEKPEPFNQPLKNEVPDEIIAKLKEAGFDTSQGLSKSEGGYIVEYDIFLTENQIDEFIASQSPKGNQKVEHYRTNMLVGGTPRIITVYIDPSFDVYIQ
jgi:hypothetical protein